MEKKLLTVKNVSKSFNGFIAVECVNMDIYEKEIVGIIGGNGAGKTTLFNIITGFLTTKYGDVFLEKNREELRITNKTPDELSKLSIVRTFQHIRLFEEMTVRENLKASVIANKLPLIKINESLKILGIKKIANQKVDFLPYGTKRLVEMARCLCTGAKIVFLDEIGAGMTQEELTILQEKIKEIRDKKGVTFIVIEHNMRFIEEVCDRVYAMDKGKVICEGTASEVIGSKSVIDLITGRV